MRRSVAALLSLLVMSAAGLSLTPSASADEWLYVLASDTISVVPGSSDSGRVILRSEVDAVQFTDRPERDTNNTTVRSVLRDFGWSPSDRTLSGKSPNAAVSIPGSPLQIVEIRRASVTKKVVTLFVTGLSGPLTRAAGPGAVFIDDASGLQSMAITPNVTVVSDYNPQAQSISVSFQSNGVTLWSGTLSPSATSASVPSSSAGSVTMSGQLNATFAADYAQVTFSGEVTDGSVQSFTAEVIADWTN